MDNNSLIIMGVVIAVAVVVALVVVFVVLFRKHYLKRAAGRRPSIAPLRADAPYNVPQWGSITLEDSSGILKDDNATRAALNSRTVLTTSQPVTLIDGVQSSLVLYVEQLIQRVNESMFEKLRQRCVATTGNCVLVVVYSKQVTQSHIDEICKKYAAVSGVTRGEAMKRAWKNNEPNATVERSKIIFVEGMADDTAKTTILKLRNPDQLVKAIEGLS